MMRLLLHRHRDRRELQRRAAPVPATVPTPVMLIVAMPGGDRLEQNRREQPGADRAGLIVGRVITMSTRPAAESF